MDGMDGQYDMDGMDYGEEGSAQMVSPLRNSNIPANTRFFFVSL